MSQKEKTKADLLAFFAGKEIPGKAITKFLADMAETNPTDAELGQLLEGAGYRIDCGRCTCGLYSRTVLMRYAGANPAH
jgi:hypothetical protein